MIQRCTGSYRGADTEDSVVGEGSVALLDVREAVFSEVSRGMRVCMRRREKV